MYSQEAQALLIQNMFNEHYPQLIFFFKSILSHKNWRGRGKLYLKNVQKMVTPTNHVIARAGFTLRGTSGAEPLALWDFRNIFLPNTGKDQKMCYGLSAGLLALYHMLNSTLVIALHSYKGYMRT